MLHVRASALLFALLALARPTIAAPVREVVIIARPSVTHELAQTPDGFVWFATMNGLLRHDGHRIDEVTVGAGAVAAHALLVDRRGRLWIATGGGYLDVPTVPGGPFTIAMREGGGGLFVREDGRVREVLPADGRREHWVWSLAELPDGRIAAGTEEGLWLISDRVARTELPADAGAGVVAQLAPAPDGVWLGTAAGVWKLQPDGRTTSVSRRPVRNLAAAGETLWLVREEALSRWRGGEEQRVAEAGPGMLLRTVLPRATDEAWVGTNIGLYELRGGRLTRAAEALPEQTARALLGDREGNLWVSLKGAGVALLRVAAVRNVGRPEGLPTDGVLSMLPSARGSIWVATSLGLVEWSNGAAVPVPIAVPQGELSWRLRNLAEHPDGSLWLGWNRLVRRGPDGATRIVEPSPGKVRAVHVDERGDLWAGTLEGALVRARGGRPERLDERFGADAGLCQGSVELVLGRRDGGLWVAGSGGLARFDVERGAARCTPTDAFEGASVTGVAEEPPGTAWVTTIGPTGLYRLRAGAVTAVRAPGPFPSRSLYAALADGRGNVWFTSNRGVFRVSARALDAYADGRSGELPVHHVDEASGMRSTDCQASFWPEMAPWGKGGVLVATALGLAFIEGPEALPPARIRPIVDEILIDGTRAGSPVVVPALARNVTVRFAAPSFVAGPRPRLLHRLDGLDPEGVWTPSSGQLAELTRLPAGAYTFRVRAGNEEAILPLLVQAPWWRHPGVLAAAVVLAALVAFAVHRLRLRQLTARYAAVNDERARIARELHDGLAQQFLGIGFQLEALEQRVGAPGSDVSALIDDARAMVKDAQDDTRRVLWALRGGLEPDALARGLEAVAAEARRKLGVAVEVMLEGPPPSSSVLAYELPRIVHEAITNAVRHGRAQTVTVRLTSTPARLVLLIDNDGEGLHGEVGGPDHHGLTGMRERARRCGGTFVLEKHPDGRRGARVAIDVPLA